MLVHYEKYTNDGSLRARIYTNKVVSERNETSDELNKTRKMHRITISVQTECSLENVILPERQDRIEQDLFKRNKREKATINS